MEGHSKPQRQVPSLTRLKRNVSGLGLTGVKELLSLKLKKASWSGLSGVMTSEPLTVTIARPLYEPVVVPGVDPHGGTEIVSARAIEAASAVAMAITIERARTDRNPLDALGRDYPPVAVGKARKRGLARPPQPRPWGRASVPSARTMGLPWGSTREIPLTCRSSSRNCLVTSRWRSSHG